MFTKFKTSHSDHNFGEHRLVFVDAESDSKSEPEEAKEPKKSKEEIYKEEQEAKKKKIKDLKSKVKASELPGDLKKTAERVIDNQDETEVALVEQMLAGSITQKEFKKNLAKLRKSDFAEKLPDAGTHDRVSDVLVNNMKEASSEIGESNEKIGKDVKRLGGLNNQMKAVDKEITDNLQTYVDNGEISAEQAAKIVNLDPEHKLYAEKLNELLGPLSKDSELKGFINDRKERQKQLNIDAEKLVNKLNEELLELYGTFEFERIKDLRKKVLQGQLGINFEEGQELNIVAYDSEGNRIPAKAKINKVEYLIQDEDAAGDPIETYFQNALEIHNLQPPRNFKVEVSYPGRDGQEVTETLSEKAFRRWVKDMQSTEVVENKEDLEQRINLTKFGRKLKEDQEFEYISGRQNNSQPQFSTVKIEKIDNTAQEITLSEPIVIDIDPQDEPVINHKKQTVSFSEFLKWHTYTGASEKLSLDEAREIMTKIPKLQEEELGELTDYYQINHEPIKIKKGEKLKVAGQNKEFTITEVKPDLITFSNGLKLTPGHFTRLVDQYGIERASSLPNQEDITRELDKALDQDAERADEQMQESAQDLQEAISTEQNRALGDSQAPTLVTGDGDDNGSAAKETIKEAEKRHKELWEKRDKMPREGLDLNVLSFINKHFTALSLSNLGQMATTIGEYISRKWQRNAKARTARVGQGLPLVGQEFANMGQQVENEEVNQFMEKMDDQPIFQVRDRLYETSDKYEAKACLNLLTKAGALRLDDPKLWATMNRLASDLFTHKKYYQIKINMKGGKNHSGNVPQDAAKEIMDEIWGAQSGQEWETQNLSAYSSAVSGYVNEAGDYEGDIKRMGGITAELHNMLVRHQRGEHIPIGRYEGFLDFIIGQGKGTIEDKFFYLIAGVAVENPDGETLLDKKRHAAISSKYMGANLPLLEWFSSFKPLEGDGATPIPVEYCKQLVDQWGLRDAINEPERHNRYDNKAVGRYIREVVMPHSSVGTRVSKAIRNIENVDHDDAQLIVPLVNDADMIQSVFGTLRGSRPPLSQVGYANGVAGFNQFIKTLGEIAIKEEDPAVLALRKKEKFEDTKDMMAQVINSFVIYESTLCNRNQYDQKNYQRLSPAYRQSRGPLVGAKKNGVALSIQGYFDEVKEIIREILETYNYSDQEIRDFLDHNASHADKTEQTRHQNEMAQFSEKFNTRVLNGPDKGEAMRRIIADAVRDGKLTGH